MHHLLSADKGGEGKGKNGAPPRVNSETRDGDFYQDYAEPIESLRGVVLEIVRVKLCLFEVFFL